MARLAYIMLCHQDPETIIRQARLLTSQGDALAIHLDGRAKTEVFEAVRAGVQGIANVTLARRVKCGWGEWSLVQATLNALDAALQKFPFATHFYLVSGDCMPIKPAAFIHRALDENDRDHIENTDFFEGWWIKTGLRAERLTFRHWFNERKHKTWFYRSIAWQRKLGLERKLPTGIRMMIGSQWWCLRRGTIEKIMVFARKRPDIVRFFRATWIPDETFFQSLVHHLIPRNEVESRPPTLLKFSDYGMPVTFYADHYELLKNQREFFARKIAPRAEGLRANLGALFHQQQTSFATNETAASNYSFITAQGRHGTRFTPRFWQAGQEIGVGKLLLVLVCKKWHAARRLGGMIHDAGGPKNFGYVFDDEKADLPPLGGYENQRAKRLQHRRAFLHILARQEQTEALAVCIDPANLETLRDLAADNCAMHVLEMECQFDDSFLIGHADRIGLHGSALAPENRQELLSIVRRTFASERNAIRKLNLPAMFRIKDGENPAEIAEVLAGFAGIHPKRASFIAQDPSLFA